MTMHLSSTFSEDGMGSVVNLPHENKNIIMPNKIFRSSCTFLCVEDESGHVVLRDNVNRKKTGNLVSGNLYLIEILSSCIRIRLGL